jgi:endo-beta-N-acetylglucosaminidase D
MYDQCEDWTEQCTAWAEKIGRPDIIYAMNLAFEVDNKVCDYQVKKGIETS